VVVVTSDKCYENREWLYGYRETDPLGGHDPYSASKAATEMVTAAYRASYFSDGRTVAVASGRAGNVVGGGDWAVDRIVPDCVRALQSSSSIRVRNAAATRPWQHVLEPLSGYLALGSALDSARRAGMAAASGLASAFNFGPPVTSNRSVGDLVREILKHWPGRWDDASDPAAPHEAGRLALSADKAFHLLGWQSAWDFETTTRRTVDWYRRRRDGTDAAQLVRDDIATHTASTSAAASAACGDA
jgi:CDP-glucose 4,6-dehydratase